MSGTNNGVDPLNHQVTFFHIPQSSLHGVHPLKAFFEEDLMKLREITAHSKPLSGKTNRFMNLFNQAALIIQELS